MSFNEHVDTLRDDLRVVGDDLARLLEELRAQASIATGDAKERLVERIETLQLRSNELRMKLKEKTLDSAEILDSAVKENPYKAVGIAAAAGLLAGFIFGSRRRD